MNYLTELNESQRNAVTDTEGPSLVVAGAGSGKTRVLTFRIAHLLSKNVSPDTVMALTFTNKAAGEMKQRIAQIAGEHLAKHLWMGTFHSVFARILRREAATLGYSSNFTIYDSSDSQSIIKKIIKELGLDDKQYKPSAVFHRISWAKNNLIGVQDYLTNGQITITDRIAHKPLTGEIYRNYVIRCKKSDAMDFDDLLLNINILFRDFPDLLKKYQERFRYILVDEFQDTNYAQYKIVRYLSEHHKNVCVVGDDAQSIYSFRGADIRNILNFKKDFNECKIYKLEQNYRSTQNIVNAANSIIERNSNQIPKQLFSKQQQGDKIQVIDAKTDQEEAYLIARLISRNCNSNGTSYSDHVILYRTNAQSRIFEDALRNTNIPYKVYGSLSFYDRKEIKDVLAYFRLIVNHKDDEAFKRIINYPSRGIGDTTLSRIEDFANQHQITMWDVVTRADVPDIGISRSTLARIRQFTASLDNYASRIDTEPPYELGFSIVKEMGIWADLNEIESLENIPRKENVEELLNSIQELADAMAGDGETATLRHFLENVSLLTRDDKEDPKNRNHVSLMTIHSAKGLEFNHVFIAGMEENLFPNYMALTENDNLEEERRLFYVAITRARKRLCISYARERYKYGERITCTPSRFVDEIDRQYLIMPEIRNNSHRKLQTTEFKSHKPQSTVRTERFIAPVSPKLVRVNQALKNEKAKTTELFEYDDPAIIAEGMIVEHQRFGLGKVISIEGTLPDSKALVLFADSGEKNLLLKFARLRIIPSQS